MRNRTFHVLILLLAWCVGFQSTVSAMGVPCPHAGERGEAHHHHGHDAGASDEVSAQASHHEHSGHGSQASPSAATGISSLGCHCSGVGCVSSGPGIASLFTTPYFETAPAFFDLQEDLAGLRVAHGLDLIRPPSKS